MMTQPMSLALAQARLAAECGEVPVGAVIIDSQTGKVVAEAYNRTERDCDPTAHAELLAIRKACRVLGTPRLIFCDMYVTLEPCAMCASAIAHARLRRLYFGAYDVKGGAVDNGPRLFHQPTCHHRPEIIGGTEESAAAKLLKDFFQLKRC